MVVECCRSTEQSHALSTRCLLKLGRIGRVHFIPLSTRRSYRSGIRDCDDPQRLDAFYAIPL
jgi:hypothetical protein